MVRISGVPSGSVVVLRTWARSVCVASSVGVGVLGCVWEVGLECRMLQAIYAPPARSVTSNKNMNVRLVGFAPVLYREGSSETMLPSLLKLSISSMFLAETVVRFRGFVGLGVEVFVSIHGRC